MAPARSTTNRPVSTASRHRPKANSSALGSYAEVRSYPAVKLPHLPDGLDDRQVAAFLLKGMTAQYLSTPRAGIPLGTTA